MNVTCSKSYIGSGSIRENQIHIRLHKVTNNTEKNKLAFLTHLFSKCKLQDLTELNDTISKINKIINNSIPNTYKTVHVNCIYVWV